jgi:hypothetical protein
MGHAIEKSALKMLSSTTRDGNCKLKKQLKYAGVQGSHRRRKNLAIVNLFFMDFLQEKVTRIQMYETK